jgi:hypothetical protein
MYAIEESTRMMASQKAQFRRCTSSRSHCGVLPIRLALRESGTAGRWAFLNIIEVEGFFRDPQKCLDKKILFGNKGKPI